MSNMIPTIGETIEVADAINEQLGEWAYDRGYTLTVNILPYSVHGVFFGSFCLWSSELDDREEIEEGVKVTLLSHLKKELRQLAQFLLVLEE